MFSFSSRNGLMGPISLAIAAATVPSLGRPEKANARKLNQLIRNGSVTPVCTCARAHTHCHSHAHVATLHG
mgnify:CR=1 FL=1